MNTVVFEKRQLKIFLAIAFLLPYVLGILMGWMYNNGMDVSIFPNAQMFYPAAGIMLAVLLTQKDNPAVPRRFFTFFTASAAIMLLLVLLGPVLGPQPVIANVVIIAASVAGWILLLTEKKEKRAAWGLRWNRTGTSILMVLLFIALFFVRILASAFVSGTLTETISALANGWIWLNIPLLLVNFFLVVFPFLGEEYGWRYYFGPFLQNRFGEVKGVLILGVLWGLWHLPINIFYYSPQTWLQSILAQQITCICLGIFFAYTYQKTKNIWVPVLLHFYNNNLAALLSGGGADALQNQSIAWSDLFWALLINAAVFLPFLLTKEFRKHDSAVQEQTESI